MRIILKLVLIFQIAALAFAPSIGLAETSEEGINSNMAFRELMRNQNVREVYRGLQRDLVAHPADTVLLQFILKNPVLSRIMEDFNRKQDERLEHIEDELASSNLPVETGLSKKFDDIISLIKEVGAEMGLPDSAMENLRAYYRSGETNAFTISANEKSLIVGLTSGLLANMTLKEIRGVIAHEIAHILFRHMDVRIINDLMFNLLGEVYGFPMPLTMRYAITPHFRSQSVDEKLMRLALERINGLSAPEKVKLLIGWLKNMLFVVEQARESRALAAYIGERITEISRLPMRRATRPNEEQFRNVLRDIKLATSRIHEFSADRGGISGSSVDAAASFAGQLLMRLPFENEESKEKIFEAIQRQAEALNKKDPDAIADLRGTTHPSGIFRVDEILRVPVFPMIAFNNRFIRLLLISEGILDKIYDLENQADLLRKELEVRSQVGTQRAQNDSIRIAKKIADLAVKIGDLKAQKMLTDRYASDIIIQQGVSSEKNPAFENLVEYYSIRKQSLAQLRANLLTQISKLQALMAKAKEQNASEEDIQKVEAELKKAAQMAETARLNLDLQMPVVDMVMIAIQAEQNVGSEILKMRESQLKRLYKTDSKPRTYANLRAELVKNNPSIENRSRIPVNTKDLCILFLRK